MRISELPTCKPWLAERRAFTLPEVMVTLSVSMLAMAGLLTTYLFGLRLLEFAKPKMTASDSARVVLGRLVDDIRSATLVRVGTGGSSSFAEPADGALQEGNAIQLCLTTNTNNFIRYFVDASAKQLRRTTTNGSGGQVLASFLTNTVAFTAEDYAGTIATNSQNNRVIGVQLQFYQIEYPVIRIGPGLFYDSYQVRTRVTKRTQL